jgi:aspartyl-tRNA(Asn)/glutamyl-tRNA(Gln) amidotransferase subunit B
MNYIASIGLEVHVQLKTQSKMFCGCSTRYGADPNTQVCPVCLGYPGAMPSMNESAIQLTVFTGMAIGCHINAYSKFDRKSYFYPDMPKNYQITQYDLPLCGEGHVEIDGAEGTRQIRIKRIHLEEDVAKNTHFERTSGVDFNRAGVPLMEIVTEPDMHHPEEALALLQSLKEILLYAGVSNGNLEEGNIRCDVNCSVRSESSEVLGTKTEIKNLNTFRGAQQALKFEIARQQELLRSGGEIIQETRRWDVDSGQTFSMRTKEDAHDYRYFPEPDLMPVVISADSLEEWRQALPEMPRERRERLIESYGIPEYDAGVLATDRFVADFFEDAAKQCGNAKAVSNLIMTEMLRLLDEEDKQVEDVPVTPAALAALVDLVDAGTVNSNTAKDVFGILFREGGDPGSIVKERGLVQVSDSGEIESFVEQVITEHAQSVEDYRGGKKAALQFLVGQVMRSSRGKANPKVVAEMLTTKLDTGA